MTAPVSETPALVRSPQEGQHGGHEPEHILTQLSAALENPDIKALEWSKNGQAVLVHTGLYEEEMGKNKELFPELADLSCVAALKAWLLAHGFERKRTKAKSQMLRLQHSDFRRVHPTTEEPGTSKGDAGPSAKQQKKKRSPPPGRATLGKRRRRRVRPLYEYINLDMPELMHPSEEEEVPELAQPSQIPADPGMSTAPQLEGTWASSAPDIPVPQADHVPMQIDIDAMLRHAAQLVPELFPQYK